MLPAVDAVMVKMPAPITTDTPKTVRSHQVRSLRSRVSGSSVSAIDCSTDLVRQAIGIRPWSALLKVSVSRVSQGTAQYRMEYRPAMGRSGEHAIVIGASLGGLCAARVLSDFYDRVTVYERDDLPDGPANRAAVPQGRHVHLLMARGAAGVRRAVPRSARRHGRRGVPILENRPDCIHFGAAGHVLGTARTGCGTSSPPMCRAGRIWSGRSGAGSTRSPTSTIVHAGDRRAACSTPPSSGCTGVLLGRR